MRSGRESVLQLRSPLGSVSMSSCQETLWRLGSSLALGVELVVHRFENRICGSCHRYWSFSSRGSKLSRQCLKKRWKLILWGPTLTLASGPMRPRKQGSSCWRRTSRISHTRSEVWTWTHLWVHQTILITPTISMQCSVMKGPSRKDITTHLPRMGSSGCGTMTRWLPRSGKTMMCWLTHLPMSCFIGRETLIWSGGRASPTLSTGLLIWHLLGALSWTIWALRVRTNLKRSLKLIKTDRVC